MDNKGKLYYIVLGIRNKELKAELKGSYNFDKKDASFYSLCMLKKIKIILSGIKQISKIPMNKCTCS